MRRAGIGLLCALGGYLLGVLVGYVLVHALSGNTHDRSVEAAMTGAFVVGPFSAVIAFVLGVVFGGRKPRTS
jgi:F0F1-type ATP synthase membrane subunit c/vacuolar-type H+-ATPase subunit K